MLARQWIAYLRGTSLLRLLAWSALWSTLLATGIYIAFSYAQWSGAQSTWAEYVASGVATRCQAVERLCDEELAAQPKAETDAATRGSNPYFGLAKRELCIQQREREQNLRHRQSEWFGYESTSCGKSKPLEFSTALVSSDYISQGKPAGLAVLIWGALVAGIALVRLFGREPNLGWKRLAVLAAPVAGAAAWLYAADEGWSVEPTAFAIATSSAAAAALVLVGRALYTWVAQGFSSSANVEVMHPDGLGADKPASTKPRSDITKWAFITAAGAVLMMVAFVVNPDAALRSYVSTGVQALGLVIAIYVGRWAVAAFKSRHRPMPPREEHPPT
jgi:hypothetical protein